ncbi:MAG: DUF3313 family protein [Colwellia sp.]
MKMYSKMSVISLAIFTMLGCTTTSDAPAVSPEGMNLKVSTRSTIAYKKEGVDFSEYDKVKLVASQVSFKKNWKRDYNRDQASLSNRVKDDDMLRIKNEVAVLFDEVLKEELSSSKYDYLVDKVDGKTLLIKPAIIDLDVYAPDLMTASRGRTYTQESGEATLFLEVYDAVSGEILARIIDNEVVGDRGYANWSNRVSNRADAKRTIRKWAVSLREKLDAQHVTK